MAMKTPVHPGEILREDVLAELNLGVSEAASRLGVSRVALSRVLHGHARISPALAIRLEEAGAGTARTWLALQSAYDLAAARASGTPKVRPLIEVA
ncbi:MAG TPA: HigA family addiction module antitoxin [Marmoricola sp.]|nr:HigA family addiction module antitoxin [Marmoricola sp.]